MKNQTRNGVYINPNIIRTQNLEQRSWLCWFSFV